MAASGTMSEILAMSRVTAPRLPPRLDVREANSQFLSNEMVNFGDDDASLSATSDGNQAW
jgi:hypothetical protein